jgi:hypothetical protein
MPQHHADYKLVYLVSMKKIGMVKIIALKSKTVTKFKIRIIFVVRLQKGAFHWTIRSKNTLWFV